MSEQIALQPGQRLEKYEIVRLLGRSPLTEVYRANDPDRQRAVAIKIIRPQHATPEAEAAARQRFMRDLKIVASMQHPNILPVYDFGFARGVYYVATQIVEGGSLRDYLSARRHPLPAEFALSVFEQVADALAYAHDRGMVHEDLRPGNVLLENGELPLLADFGVTHITSGDPLTTPVASTGAPLYMSPEQAAGRGITRSSDIYALGIMLYEMLTGDVPFKGSSVATVLVKHMQEAPRPPSELNVEIDPRVETVILTALAKTPQDRYSSARGMIEALQKPVTTGQYDTLSLKRDEIRDYNNAQQPASESVPAAASPPDRGRLLYVIAGGALVLIIVVLVVLLVGGPS